MTEYVINCAGEKVPVSGTLFESRCVVGNLEDYLEANEGFVIEETQAYLDIPKISIVMPIYRSGAGFLESLNSVYEQKWQRPEGVEIFLYINQPRGVDQDKTLESIKCAKDFIAKQKDVSSPKIRIIYEQLDGGLPEVYQRSFTSLVGRIQESAKVQNFATKEELSADIEDKMNAVFVVVDDDLIFSDNHSLCQALESIERGKNIVTGQIEITEVSTLISRWDSLLIGLMNLFFRFKQEQGTATLTPRGITVKDMFHQPNVEIGSDYADQVWFAAGAIDKQRIIVNAFSTLEGEDYPSNAKMTACLSRFLEHGEEGECLGIFEAIASFYDNSCACAGHKYSSADVSDLVKVLRNRDFDEIESFVTGLCAQ